MRLIANVIGMSHDNFPCNSLTTVQDIQDYASLIFFGTQSPFGRVPQGIPQIRNLLTPVWRVLCFAIALVFNF